MKWLMNILNHESQGLQEARAAEVRAEKDEEEAKNRWQDVFRVRHQAEQTTNKLEKVFEENGFSRHMYHAITRGHQR